MFFSENNPFFTYIFRFFILFGWTGPWNQHHWNQLCALQPVNHNECLPVLVCSCDFMCATYTIQHYDVAMCMCACVTTCKVCHMANAMQTVYCRRMCPTDAPSSTCRHVVFSPCGSPAPVWTCSSSVSSAGSSPPCPHLSSTETGGRGGVRWGTTAPERPDGGTYFDGERQASAELWAMSYDEDRSNGVKLNGRHQKELTGQRKLHNTSNGCICNQLSQFQANRWLKRSL